MGGGIASRAKIFCSPLWKKGGMLPRAHALVVAGLAAYTVGMLLLLQFQLHRLRCADSNAAITKGVARLVADVLRTTAASTDRPSRPTASATDQAKDPPLFPGTLARGDAAMSAEKATLPSPLPFDLLRALEASRFRAVRTCVFATSGDVLLDSEDPCADPHGRCHPPSARQEELWNAVLDADKRRRDHRGAPDELLSGTIFRPCDLRSSQPEMTTFAAVLLDNLTVVATACGRTT